MDTKSKIKLRAAFSAHCCEEPYKMQSMLRWVLTISWLRPLEQAAGNLWDPQEAKHSQTKTTQLHSDVP